MEQKLLNKMLDDFDALTGFYTVMQSDHRHIHQGKGQTALINTGSISAVYRIGFKTPTVASGKFIHWRPAGVQTSANYIDIQVTEGDSYTSGSTVTPINRNRNLTSIVSVMQDFKTGVTATPSGTLIQHVGLGTSGNEVSKSGGGSGAEQELVLLPNTDYVITITPSGATIVTLELFWYEQDGYAGN